MHILLVEDEPRLSILLRRGLTEEGHEVRAFVDLEEATAGVALEPPAELYLLDRTLPDGDGLDWLRGRRALGDRTPALILIARDQLADRVQGLREGADDYLGKPFAFEELCARIEALARRAAPARPADPPALDTPGVPPVQTHGVPPVQTLSVPPVQNIGAFTLDRRRHELRRVDEVIPLTPQEFRLLDDLARHAGEARSRADLLRDVWDLSFDPGTNVVDVYIRYLRQKLGGVDYIHTVRGVGYRLDPPE